jgi:hypothetical protein
MTKSFTVTFEDEISSKDTEKVSRALHRAVSKWFRQGHNITVVANE